MEFPLPFARETPRMARMRIMVQDSGSRTFFDGVNWAQDARQAKTFDSVAQAEMFCQHQNLHDALVIVRMNGSESDDLCYPVGKRSALLVSKGTTRIKSLF